MKNNVFIVLVIALLVWGGTVGAAFAGGMTVGKSRAEASPSAPVILAQPTATPTAAPTQAPLGPAGQGQFNQLRQQLLDGQDQGTPLTQEQLDQLRQQFQNRQGQGGQGGAGAQGGALGGQAFAGRGGLQGTVEKIEGNTLTINTPQGSLQAKITATTQIEAVTTGKVSDIAVGTRITVTGQRAADGTTEAATVLIVPEGFTGGLGGLLGGAGRAATGGT